MEYRYNTIYNQDSLDALMNIKKQGLKFNCIFSDPPWGLNYGKRNAYSRSDSRPNVIPGYIDIPKKDYKNFSKSWISLASDCLVEDGLLIIISGYSNVGSLIDSLEQNDLYEINNLIWHYNFGVYCPRRHCSSHANVLVYSKAKSGHYYDPYARYSKDERDERGKSLSYRDRQSVITTITRERWPEKYWTTKTKLPMKLIGYLYDYYIPKDEKNYSILDPFLGSGQTGIFFKEKGHPFLGIEKNPRYFNFAAHRLVNDRYYIPATERIPAYPTSCSL